MDSADQNYDQTEDPLSRAPAEPPGALVPVHDGVLSPSAYELLCHFLGEAGARRVRQYMHQNVQYDDNSFLCLDTLLDAAVLEAAAKTPLQLAAGIAELKTTLAEEARQRQAAFDEFLRMFVSAQPSQAKLAVDHQPTVSPPTRKLYPWNLPPPPEPLFQRFKAACRTFVAREKKLLMACLVCTTLGVWIGKHGLENERAQRGQEQASLLLSDWQNHEAAVQAEWRDQQAELLAQERARMLAEVQRQFGELIQQLRTPAPVAAETVPAKNSSKRSPR